MEHTAAIALAGGEDGCAGAWLLGHDELRLARARMTLLATGGACALFARTTNPPGAIGDGIALAYRAGAVLRDMEFVQFHPTALAGGGRAFLISEAVRGEGAHLVDGSGDRFMTGAHPDAELAPRDVVTKAILAAARAGGTAYLSLRHLDRARVAQRFPNLVAAAPAAGFDLCADLVPVAPAAHYLMGGIATDLDGATRSPGSSPAASAPRPGARRQPARVQFAARVLCVLAPRGRSRPRRCRNGSRPGSAARPAAGAGAAAGAAAADVAGRRAGARRGRALAPAAWIGEQPRSNPMLVAELIAAAAQRRTESRGAHLRRDFPDTDPTQARSIVPTASLQSVIDAALAEDAGRGDPTTDATVPAR